MVNSESQYEETRGEMYFIIPRRKNMFLSDLIALKMLNELHRIKRINNLFLNFGEEYPAVERYCSENETEPIDITKIFDNSEILEEATSSQTFKRFAYLSQSEDMKSLKRVSEQLSEKRFYVETRIANIP